MEFGTLALATVGACIILFMAMHLADTSVRMKSEGAAIFATFFIALAVGLFITMVFIAVPHPS